jgi:hypothetical protein
MAAELQAAPLADERGFEAQDDATFTKDAAHSPVSGGPPATFGGGLD